MAYSYHPMARRSSLRGRPVTECNLHLTRITIQSRMRLYCERTQRRYIEEYDREILARAVNEDYIRWMQYGMERGYENGHYINLIAECADVAPEESPSKDKAEEEEDAIASWTTAASATAANSTTSSKVDDSRKGDTSSSGEEDGDVLDSALGAKIDELSKALCSPDVARETLLPMAVDNHAEQDADDEEDVKVKKRKRSDGDDNGDRDGGTASSIDTPTSTTQQQLSIRRPLGGILTRNSASSLLSADEAKWFEQHSKRCLYFETDLQINYNKSKSPFNGEWTTSDSMVLYRADALRYYLLCGTSAKENSCTGDVYKAPDGSPIMVRHCVIIVGSGTQKYPCLNVKDVRIQARRDLKARKEDGMKRWFWEVGAVGSLHNPKVAVDSMYKGLVAPSGASLTMVIGSPEYEAAWCTIYNMVRDCVHSINEHQ